MSEWIPQRRDDPARSRQHRAPLLMLVPFVAACAEQTHHPPVEVRDSAGIRITTHAALPAEYVALGEEPLLTIGAAQGGEGDVLHRVRGAVRLGSRTVVADAGTKRLLYYGPEGEFERSAGADGGGPGEFRSMGGVFAVGDDSVAVFDWSNRRLSYFDAEGAFLGATRFRTDAAGVQQPIGSVDGAVLVQVVPPATAGTETGMIRNTARYYVSPPEGIAGDSVEFVASLPVLEIFALVTERGRAWRPVLFAHSARAATCTDGFFLGSGDAYEIRFIGSDGALRSILRAERPPRPVTDELVDAAIAQRVAGESDPALRAAQERAWSETPHPEFLPAHGEILASRDCELWVEDQTLPGERAEWSVFGRDGSARGRVRMPDGFERLLWIDRDRLIALFTDEYGVEQVRSYPLPSP